MKTKIKTIDINAKQWFDRINGNSYFSAQITVNYGMKSEKAYYLPFQYGYGDSYLDHSLSALNKQGIITSKYLRDLREEKIIVRYNKIENCKKRDVVAFGMADMEKLLE